jgi:hypothetical protein
MGVVRAFGAEFLAGRVIWCRRPRARGREGKVLQSQVPAGANQRAQGSEDADERGARWDSALIPRPIAADRHATSVTDAILARHRGGVTAAVS